MSLAQLSATGCVGFVALFCILLQVGLAWDDNFLTPRQMMTYHGRGLPLLWHFGILWGDLLFVTPLITYLVAKYGNQWSVVQIAMVGVAAFIISTVMHYQYLKDTIPNSHMHDGKLTPAAYVHFLYMWGAVTVILLFFLYAWGVPNWLVIFTAAGVWLHIVLGTHLVVKFLSPKWFPPQPLVDLITLVVWTGAGAVLALLAWAKID